MTTRTTITLNQDKLEDCVNFRIKSYIRAANSAISDNIAKEYSAMADELRTALKSVSSVTDLQTKQK